MGKRKRPTPLIVKEAPKNPESLSKPSILERVEVTDQFIIEVLQLFEELRMILNKDKAESGWPCRVLFFLGKGDLRTCSQKVKKGLMVYFGDPFVLGEFKQYLFWKYLEQMKSFGMISLWYHAILKLL